MAMSRQGNNVLYCFLFCLFIISCNKHKKYDAEEIQKIRQTNISFSKSIAGENEYYNIYCNINDTVISWIDNQLRGYRYFNEEREWLVDSILCINKGGNKLITGILKRSLSNESTGDFIKYFYGVKIKEEWYFFPGPTLVLPREYYQEDIHTPLSFEKLQQIATAHIYRGYLKQGKKGQWEINDRFFDQIIPSKRTLEIYNLKDEEEYVKFMVEINWSSDIAATFKKYREN